MDVSANMVRLYDKEAAKLDLEHGLSPQLDINYNGCILIRQRPEAVFGQKRFLNLESQ
jgi:hypothetical protein